MSNSYFIAGPSHVGRFIDYTKSGIIPKIGREAEIYGPSSLPIWSPELLAKIKAGDYSEIFLIVGDFRFGNAIFKTHSGNPPTRF
jgi:hypothetical protein